jgi:hypothetical protein
VGVLAAATLIPLLVAIFAPNITAYAALVHPTCDDPRGLSRIPADTISAQGPSLDNTKTAARALDRSMSTMWAPPVLRTSEFPPGVSSRGGVVLFREKPVLTLNFDGTHDVQLVCTVNGLASGYGDYVNWARVQSVEAWTDKGRGDSRVSVLRSLDQGQFQNYQDVQVPEGMTNSVTLLLRDTYPGQQTTTVDPDKCGTRDEVGPGKQNDPIGCNLNPTAIAGLAEIVVYEKGWTWRDVITGRFR